jgi:hypothetical protein
MLNFSINVARILLIGNITRRPRTLNLANAVRIETVAILIREPGNIGNCLSSIDFLRCLQARIQIVLLEANRPCDSKHTMCRLLALQEAGIECFADASGEMQALGFQALAPERIARLLTSANMVIAL